MYTPEDTRAVSQLRGLCEPRETTRLNMGRCVGMVNRVSQSCFHETDGCTSLAVLDKLRHFQHSQLTPSRTEGSDPCAAFPSLHVCFPPNLLEKKELSIFKSC